MAFKFIGLLSLFFLSHVALSQKSLNINQCEEQFLKNNLFLLASHYNIDASKALTIQAKLWENPYFTADLNAFNPLDNKTFDIGPNGQKAFAIQQLIYLGNKKRNQVRLSKTNEEVAELEFQDLLRTLKFQLRRSFYIVYFNNKKIETNDVQIANIDTLVKAYSVQTQKGNVPLKDLVRLQSLLINFRNARIEIINSNIEEQNTLQLLLNETVNINPLVDNNHFDKYNKDIAPTQNLLDSIAAKNRPDYLLAIKNIEVNEWTVKLQRSLAMPDLTLGASYDQRSGAFNDQVDLTLGLPLPLWNRNQGNIKYAKAILEQSKLEQQNSGLKLRTEVSSSYIKWQEARKNYNQLSPSTIADFDAVYKGVLQNFQKRNISILEFTDFMESYNQMSIQLNEFKKNIAVSGEELNLVLNTTIF